MVNSKELMKSNQDHLKEMAAKRRADILREHEKSAEIQARAAHAYSRLMNIAEREDTGQALRIAKFLAATFNGRSYPFDFFEMRNLDFSISDDMLVCIDALRRSTADLHKLVPDGYVRAQGIIEKWEIAVN